MSDVVKVKVIVFEDGEKKRELVVGYFPGQDYVVKIDTPEGVDRQYTGKAVIKEDAAGGSTGIPGGWGGSAA